MQEDYPTAIDVLLVHQDEAVRSRVAENIRAAGYSVEEARNSDEADIVMKLWPVHTVVLGSQMPKIAEFQSMSGLPHPPVVIRLQEAS